MFIDPHVHFRDFKQSHKETVRHGLETARDSGLIAVLDMPNTDPPIMYEDLIKDRLKLAKEADVKEVFYGLYIGLTANPEQIKGAVEIVHEYPQVIGMKLYAGHSVGNLGVTRHEEQRLVFDTLAKEGYEGVIAVHSEEESLMDSELWNPKNPISHCYARPPDSEITSVQYQIEHATETKFKGKLHIPHISTPDAVDLLVAAKASGLDVSSGVCPHHMIFNYNQMMGDNGIMYKMNPPLRPPGAPQKMIEYLREGKIDWVETDHAPHSLTEKTAHPYMSGIPGLPWWDLFAEFLRRHNFSEAQVQKVTRDNAMERYGLDLDLKERPRRERKNDYPFNPYQSLEQQLKQAS